MLGPIIIPARISPTAAGRLRRSNTSAITFAAASMTNSDRTDALRYWSREQGAS
ncbi:MAG: hypothetical protein ABI999_11125 [Acidobacteriota bacterium]